MNLLKMTDLDLNGKRVLIRQDLNVPIKNGEVTSDKRIVASLPTILTASKAGAKVIIKPNSLYTLFNLPSINQVYIFFRAELANLNFAPGVESEEVDLFGEEDIPWGEIAFPVVKTTIANYFEDRRSGNFPVRMFDVHHHPGRKVTTEIISDSSSQSIDRN